MKRTILALLALGALLAPSCNKQTPLVRLCFSVGEYGYFPTKGMADAISATLPSSLDLTLKNNATGATYSTTTGQVIELPAGTYTITGDYSPEATKMIYGNALYLSHSPKVSVSEVVEIVPGTTEYNLTANYESLALAVVTQEVDRWMGATSTREGFDIETLTEGAFQWTFLSGDMTTDRRFQTTIKPADGTAMKTFTIIGNPELQQNFADAVLAEPGRWYILRVSDAEILSGSIALEWPAWTQG